MAVTNGSYTVGSGGDYATWKAVMDDIDGQTLDGDLTFTQISDVSETVGPPLVEVTCTGYKLTFTSNNPHNGDFTKGWITTSNQRHFFYHAYTGGNVEISHLNVNKTYASAAASWFNIMYTGSGASVLVHDCIARFATTYGLFAEINSNNGWTYYNCISIGGQFHRTGGTETGRKIYNCSFYVPGNAYNSGILGNYDIQNCVVTDAPTTCYATSQVGNGKKNASSDETGSEVALHNVTAASVFRSVDPTLSSCMDIVQGGPTWQAGKAILVTGQTKDIRGRKLPNNRGKYSIGACCAWDNQTFEVVQTR